MKIKTLLCMLAMAGCTHVPVRDLASTPQLGQEIIPPEEAEATKQILELVAKGYERAKPAKDVTGRIIHHKEHGCLKGKFEVLENIPQTLKYGIFAEARSHEAWIRVSNGSGSRQHDSIPDARGLAIKLLNIEGEKLGDEIDTQDFLLQSAPNFFAKDVEGYVKFMKSASRPGVGGVAEMLKDTKLNDKADRKGLGILVSSADVPGNPLTAEYFSALPQKLGPHAMKLHARGCNDVAAPASSFTGRFKKDHLKSTMTDHLKNTDACIEFFVQVQTDAVKMPIEDAQVVWDTKLSPFVMVAKIQIPKQDFSSPKRREFCENVSFNPWHTIPAHRPLGGLNRVRKLVYEKSQLHRHKLNNQRSFEPKAGEIYE